MTPSEDPQQQDTSSVESQLLQEATAAVEKALALFSTQVREKVLLSLRGQIMVRRREQGRLASVTSKKATAVNETGTVNNPLPMENLRPEQQVVEEALSPFSEQIREKVLLLLGGRIIGRIGGPARARALTPQRRSEIAAKAGRIGGKIGGPKAMTSERRSQIARDNWAGMSATQRLETVKRLQEARWKNHVKKSLRQK